MGHSEAATFMFIKAIRPFVYLDINFCIFILFINCKFCIKFHDALGEVAEERDLAFIQLRNTAARVE